MISPSILRNQRGDTLVEVTIALSILATVLTSGFLIANRAYMIGQNARERTEIVNLAQAQAERLKNYRDVNTWTDFGGGITASPSCPSELGITSCFYMTASGVPIAGSTSAISSNGSIAITKILDVPGKYADFEIVYALNPRGGGAVETNRIPVKLADLDGIFQ